MMNNFEKMMETMMEQYMEKAMEKMMAKMFSGMMGEPEVAKAEVVKVNNSMSLEDFLALEPTEEPVKVVKSTKEPLDFIVKDFLPKGGKKYRKGIAYNQYTTKTVWTYNHIMIRNNYPNIKYSNGCYYADTTADLQAFASSYHIVDKLNDEQVALVKKYWESKKNK